MCKAEKRIINSLLAIAIVFTIALALCIVRTPYAYAEPGVASVTRSGVETVFPTLQDAFDYAKDNETVVLVSDATESEKLKKIEDTTLTIDLAGHSYTNTFVDTSGNVYKEATFSLGNDAHVIIKDSSENGTGALIAEDMLLKLESSSSELRIEGGKYVAKGTSGHNDYFATIYNRGKLTITSGTVINEGKNPAIHNSNNNEDSEPIAARLDITGGTVQSKWHALHNRGTANINGGAEGVHIISNAPTPTGSGTYFALYCTGGKTVVDGNTTVIAENDGIAAVGAFGPSTEFSEQPLIDKTLTINNGEFNGPVETGDWSMVAIKGGTFNDELSIESHTLIEIDNCLLQGVLRVRGGSTEALPPKVTINDGTFKSGVTASNFARVYIKGGKFLGDTMETIFDAIIDASGGYFEKDIVKDYIAQGYRFVDNIDEPQLTYGYLYAVKPDTYRVVKYDTNGGTKIAGVGVSQGDPLPIPEDNPEKAGGIFEGWYYDSDFTKPVQAGDTVTDDVTMHAAWKVLVTKLRFRTIPKSLKVGEKYKVLVSVNPSNATNTEVEWSSNNESVITINQNGVVTGISEGTAWITATASS